MKKIINISIVIMALSTFSSFSYASPKCSEDVYSPAILEVVNSSFKDSLERHETTYTVGVSLNSYETPKYCFAPVKNVVRILIPVNVNYWNEEGEGQSQFQTDCFMELARYKSEPWEPSYLSCEELQIDEDL